ncbi:MAG: SPASM domain-containing protein [Patescibacteria group bacterium]
MINSEMILKLWPELDKSKELFKWLKDNSVKIKNSLANLSAIEVYYLEPKKVLKYRCFAGQRNMVVYPTGDLSLCFKRKFIGNIKKEKLKKIMKRNALLERRSIRGCGKYCRIIGCNFSRGLLEIMSKK